MIKQNNLSLETIFSLPYAHQIFDSLRDRIANKLTTPDKFDDLSHGEKLLWLINWFIWEINNGGFEIFLFNSTGDYTHEIIGFFEEIGAVTTQQLLTKAANVFPDGLVPKDCQKRREIICGWRGKKRKQLEVVFMNLNKSYHNKDEDLCELTIEYAQKNQSQFE